MFSKAIFWRSYCGSQELRKPQQNVYDPFSQSLSLAFTGSAIFILYFGLVALEGSTFHQNFYVAPTL